MSTTKLVSPADTVVGSVIQTEYGNYTIASDGTVVVDSRVVTALIGAGYVLFSDDLPIGKAVTAGSHVTTAEEASANAVAIDTGLSNIDTVIVQVLDAGNNVVTADADITNADGTVTIADGTTYNTVAGQAINWIAYGTI